MLICEYRRINTSVLTYCTDQPSMSCPFYWSVHFNWHRPVSWWWRTCLRARLGVSVKYLQTRQTSAADKLFQRCPRTECVYEFWRGGCGVCACLWSCLHPLCVLHRQGSQTELIGRMCVSRRLEVVVEADSSCCHSLSGSGMFTSLMALTHTHTHAQIEAHTHTHSPPPYLLCYTSAHTQPCRDNCHRSVIITFLLWYNHPHLTEIILPKLNNRHKCLNVKERILFTAAKSAWGWQIWGAVLSRGRQTGGASICHRSYRPGSCCSPIQPGWGSEGRLLSLSPQHGLDSWHQCRKLKQSHCPAFLPLLTNKSDTALIRFSLYETRGFSLFFLVKSY